MPRISDWAEVVTLAQSMNTATGAHERLRLEVRDRQVDRQREADQAEYERRDLRPPRDAVIGSVLVRHGQWRSAHFMPIALAAAMTPELEQTLPGCWLVSVQIAAV